MPQLINPFHHFRFLFAIIVCLIFVASCGRSQNGNTSSTQSSADVVTPSPTMPAGNFTAVGEQSGLTDTSTLTQTTPITQASSAAMVDLTRGENAYTKNKCGDCHGAKGEGVADQGKAIAGTALSLNDFDVLLRTGGGLGNTHIFGRSAVSPSGMEALYSYVQSLAGN